MATLTLTDLDKELLDGLPALTDEEIGRVQAHLAAGLPMKKDYGWDAGTMWPFSHDQEPSCFGCLIGVSMSPATFNARRAERTAECNPTPVYRLAADTFPIWAEDGGHDPANFQAPIRQEKLDRLAALLDMEWSRRHPVPAASSQEAILPTLKEAVLA